MNHLSETDVETIRTAIGDHQGHVALPREVLDVLLRDVRCWPPGNTLGFPYNLAAKVRKV